MKDTYEAIEGILTSSTWSTSNIKRIYGIDLVNYSWVDGYLRDKEIRAKIADLKKEIPQIESLPIHRDELKTDFIEALKQINGRMINQIRGHLITVQERKELLMSLGNIQTLKPVYPINLTEEEIDSLFSELPEGIKQSEISKRVKQVYSEIEQLEQVIRDELSPRDRWFHHENGNPKLYPEGCRWTRFIFDWRQVVSRFNGHVNINGCALESDAEGKAFFALGLDKVRKREPLNKILVKPPKRKTGKELYDESVRINPIS